MRRLTIIFIVALIILVTAPAGVGHVATARQQVLVDRLSRTVPGVALVTESVETGWLTSRLRHRLIVSDQRLLALAADLVAEGQPAEPPAIVVESLLAHGPWPVLQGRPGLARVRSTLSLTVADAPPIELPGEAITDIGYLGGGQTRLVLAEVKHALPGSKGLFRTDGVDATVRFDRELTDMRSHVEVRRLELISPRGAIETESVFLEGDTRRSPDGLWVGESSLSLAGFALTDTLGAITAIDDLRLVFAGRTEDGLLEQTALIHIDMLTTPQWSARAIRLDTAAERLDAATLTAVIERARLETETTLPPDLLRDLLRAGPIIEIRNLEVANDAGNLEFALRVELPEERAMEVTDAGALLSALEGAGRLTIDETLLGRLLAVEGQSADPYSLVSMGFLRPHNGRFSAEVQIGGGLITLNGQPLPIRW